MNSSKEKIKEIEKKLREASDAYYNSDSPILSDQEFDALKDELESLDANNAFLSTVGAPTDEDSALQKVRHEIPMGSLKKINHANSKQEYQTWLNSIGTAINSSSKLAVSWKLDGSSIEIIYRKGEFVQAITRGDGIIGEDVTHTIKNANGFPKVLPEKVDISVRVEALFPLSKWNDFLFKEGANPRNVAAGTVRRTDGRNAEHLDCVAFNVVGKKSWNSIEEKINWLSSNGFKVVNTRYLKPQDVPEYIKSASANRSNLPYEIDGFVVSVDNCDAQNSLGEKDGLPYWARAWKLPPMGGFTALLDVKWNVGTRGSINPVATVAPVSVGGVVISNVTLHNIEEIKRIDIAVNDQIEVVRAGDVIPKVVRVVKKSDNRVLINCQSCPSCERSVVQRGPFLFCSDPEHCIGVQNKRIMKYIKKREIMFLGDSSLEKLINAKKVSCIKDLYFLTVDSMTQAGLGKTMSLKILEEIKKSMDVSLSDFLGSLSIDLLGRSEAENIVEGGIVTLKMWEEMKPTDLFKIGGFQSTKANRICSSLKQNWKTISELAQILNIQEGIVKPKSTTKTGKLQGQSFCFTGTASRPRKELQKLVETNGGVFSDAVDSTLNFLVIADFNSTSSKAVKARKMNIKMISEEQFVEMIK